MSQMEIDRVLSQIRALRTQVNPGATGALAPVVPGAPGAAGAQGAVSFAAVLRNGIEAVNAQQATARAAATAFEQGRPGVDLPQVMLEMQKASVSFRAAVEVRNKLVGAYQDIMNMPV
jgi:flagellar hook-basal body complex protein FliE